MKDVVKVVDFIELIKPSYESNPEAVSEIQIKKQVYLF